MGTRRRVKRRRKSRIGGNITLNGLDGTQAHVQYSDTDSVMTIKKRIHAQTGKWYNICAVRTDGGAPPVCAGANRHNSLYRTLRAAGVAPREGYELFLTPAAGPGGASPYRPGTRKRFSYLPGKKRKGRKTRRSPATTKRDTVEALGMLLVQLEDEALALEANGMDRDIEEVRLRQQREGHVDEDEIAVVRSDGLRDVRRKLDARLWVLLRHGMNEEDHLRRPMWLPQGTTAFRWRGGRLDAPSRRNWHGIVREYLEQGEIELMDLAPAAEEGWRWSSYIRGLHKSIGC